MSEDISDSNWPPTVDNLGLTTREALRRLHVAIERELDQHRCCFSWKLSAVAVLSGRSRYSCRVEWLLMCVAVFLLIAGDSVSSSTLVHWSLTAVIALALVCWLGASVLLQRIFACELFLKAHRLSQRIRQLADSAEWSSQVYSPLLAPRSPCISLQWTYRDCRLVNLPAALLVDGDVVVLGPGDVAFADLEQLKSTDDDDPSTHVILARLQTFPVDTDAPQDVDPAASRGARLVSAPECRRFRVVTTPFVQTLSHVLTAAGSRPEPRLRRYVRVFVRRLMLLTCVLAVVTCVGAALVRHFWSAQAADPWRDTLAHALVISALCLVSVSPIAVRLILLVAEWWCQARLNVVVARSQSTSGLETHDDYDAGTAAPEYAADVFEQPDEVASPEIPPSAVWACIPDIVRGRCDSLSYTTVLVHALGTLSSLCCVDKQGVLSWPVPTVEKVATCQPRGATTTSVAAAAAAAASDTAPQAGTTDVLDVNGGVAGGCDGNGGISARLDVLNLTSVSPARPWTLQFDDPSWRCALDRLKPVGFSVLASTCSRHTLVSHERFDRRLRCVRQAAVAGGGVEDAHGVASPSVRHCLCRLARQIGFTDNAVDGYRVLSQIAVCQRTMHERVPHMTSVVLRGPTADSMQLMSQGSADLVLSTCCEYWDGHRVRRLLDSDRRRLLDFYNRHALTMYCVALAYRPLSTHCGRATMPRSQFLELASGFSVPAFDGTPAPGGKLTHRSVCQLESQLDGHQYMSTDSLYEDLDDSADGCSALTDAESARRMVSDQIFLGMLTMQYQVLPDVVVLIDQLEKACVRFVHFSKENELRSRVFSEKMGLESGWNCHISLLDEKESGANEPVLSCSAHDGRVCARSLRLPVSTSPCVAAVHADVCSSNRSSKLDRLVSVSAPSICHLNDAGLLTSGVDERVSLLSTEQIQLSVLADQRRSVILDHNHPARQQDHATDGSFDDCHSSSGVSASTDRSTSLPFDTGNRARLPRGIAQVRPHLEHIDNVPLLVSLFTDCTPTTTAQMLAIMQQYGEVVCVLCSAASALNVCATVMADVCLALVPLPPPLCRRTRPPDAAGYGHFDDAYGGGGEDDSGLLTELAQRLNSLTCSLLLRRRQCALISQLVLEARHWKERMRAAFVFWLGAVAATVVLHLCAVAALLPAPLSPAQTVWTVWVQVVLLSVSLLFSPCDTSVMSEAQTDDDTALSSAQVWYFIVSNGVRFVAVSLQVALFCGLALWTACADAPHLCPPAAAAAAANIGVSEAVQEACLLLYCLLLIVTSASFVHQRAQIWRQAACTSGAWNMAAVVSFMGAAIFALVHAAVCRVSLDALLLVGPYFGVAVLVCVPLQLGLNELVKRHQLVYSVRVQKRARLEFDTKLGMNSPF